MVQPTDSDALRLGDRNESGLWRRARSSIQDHPGVLVAAWTAAEAVLARLGRFFGWFGLERSSRWVKPIEELVKKPLFDCRMCGQCILHSTGMTCPMTCPKQLRNGPCGGVRLDGTCEVRPEMDCVWVKAVERASRASCSDDLGRLNPPVDWQLHHTASWVTFAVGRDRITTGIGTGPHHVSEVVTP